MTREEYAALRAAGKHPSCKYGCGGGAEDFEVQDVEQGNPHEGGKIVCTHCGRFQDWLKKSKNELRRPRLKAGTVDTVWQESRGHCAHCGMHQDILVGLFGLTRTVQHVPPYAVAGEEGYKIPLCSWCQQHSASEQVRLTALVARLKQRADGGHS